VNPDFIRRKLGAAKLSDGLVADACNDAPPTRVEHGNRAGRVRKEHRNAIGNRDDESRGALGREMPIRMPNPKPSLPATTVHAHAVSVDLPGHHHPDGHRRDIPLQLGPSAHHFPNWLGAGHSKCPGVSRSGKSGNTPGVEIVDSLFRNFSVTWTRCVRSDLALLLGAQSAHFLRSSTR
jgi:hypothetical protein